MKIKMKKSNVYLFLIILGYLRTFMDIHMFSNGKITTSLSYIVLLGVILMFIHWNCKVKTTELGVLLFIIGTQAIGYMYSVFTNYPNYRIYQAIIWGIGYCIFLQLPLKPNKFDSRKLIEHCLYFMLIIGVVSAMYATLFQLGSGIFSFRDASKFNVSNIYISFWGHRNQFAVVLLGGVFASIYYINYNTKNRWQYKVCFLFMLFNIVLTLSRTVIVSIFTFFFVYLLCARKKSKKIICALSLMVLIFLFYCYVPKMNNFINTYIIRRESGMTGRELLWRKAVSFINLETVLFGRGLGIERIILKNDDVSAGIGFHNLYLTYLISGGIFMVCILVRRAMRNIVYLYHGYSRNDRFIYSWGAGTMAAILVYSVFEASTFFSLTPASIIQTYFLFVFPEIFRRNILVIGEKKVSEKASV